MTQEEISKIFTLFINDKPFDPSGLQPGLLDSWKRSRLAGTDPNADVLPEPMLEHANELYEQLWQFRAPILRPKLKSLDELMEQYSIVTSSCDSNGEAIVYYGTPAFEEYLKEKNICRGTFFTEEFSGTTAASMALHDGQKHVVVGTEHYCRCFHDLVTFAFPYKSLGLTKTRVFVFICLLSEYSPLLNNFFDSTADLILTNMQLAQSEVDTIMLYREIGQIYNQEEKGCIYVNNKGIILWLNSYAEKMALVKKDTYFGSILTDVFPEFDFMMPSISSGTPLEFSECQIVRRSIMLAFYVEGSPYQTTIGPDGFFITIQNSKKFHRQMANAAGLNARYHFTDILGESAPMIEALREAQMAASSSSSVFLSGETGTGKELFAQAIHNASSRASGPFVAVNCASITRELIGSELFGYVEGAFTGAKKGGAPGKFELADGGTIFLDEIGDMPLEMQAVLLRALEDHAVTRVGGAAPIPVNVRLITATNRDLKEKIAKGEFRADLYYRINVLNISIPPLRERTGDIEILSRNFVRQFSAEFKSGDVDFSPEALAVLNAYPFPGNVRELRNIMERTVFKAAGRMILPEHLPRDIVEYDPRPAEEASDIAEPVIDPADEKNNLLSLIKVYNGNKSMIAKVLGISRPTLYKLYTRYGLE